MKKIAFIMNDIYEFNYFCEVFKKEAVLRWNMDNFERLKKELIENKIVLYFTDDDIDGWDLFNYLCDGAVNYEFIDLKVEIRKYKLKLLENL